MRGEKAITMSKKIKVLGTEIALSSQKKEDYISLTDIARYKNPEHPADVIKNWTRSKDTIEFLGLWERINNPDFKVVEFDQFRNQAGNNSFVLSPQKWIWRGDEKAERQKRMGNNLWAVEYGF